MTTVVAKACPSVERVITSTFFWDCRNRLVNSTVLGIATKYQYDNGDERVESSTSTGGTIYPFKFYNVSTSTNGPTTYYKQIYANSELVATIKGSTTTAAAYYVHDDHLGGADVISNAAATIEQEFAYYPFGGMRVSKKLGSFSEQRRFTGHDFDPQSSLNYVDACYQDSSVGRFLSEDPCSCRSVHPTGQNGMSADPNYAAVAGFVKLE